MNGNGPISDADGGMVPSHPRGPGATPFTGDFPTVILDQLGTQAMTFKPSGDKGIYLELGGRYNKSTDRDARAYLLAPGQAGELIASLTVAVSRADPETRQMVDAAIAREQERIRAVEQEHGA